MLRLSWRQSYLISVVHEPRETRYVHPAAEQKRVVIEKFEKFRADEIIVAANKSHGVPTEVTTVERVN